MPPISSLSASVDSDALALGVPEDRAPPMPNAGMRAISEICNQAAASAVALGRAAMGGLGNLVGGNYTPVAPPVQRITDMNGAGLASLSALAGLAASAASRAGGGTSESTEPEAEEASDAAHPDVAEAVPAEAAAPVEAAAIPEAEGAVPVAETSSVAETDEPEPSHEAEPEADPETVVAADDPAPDPDPDSNPDDEMTGTESFVGGAGDAPTALPCDPSVSTCDGGAEGSPMASLMETYSSDFNTAFDGLSPEATALAADAGLLESPDPATH